MKKKLYILESVLLCFMVTGCRLPNLYDVELPEYQNEEADNGEEVPEELPETPESTIGYTPDLISVDVKDNEICCVNQYTSDEELSYAWYVVDKKSQTAVHKEPYQAENEFVYSVTEEGTFQINAYIRFADDSRYVITAAEFTYDGNKIVLDKDQG